MPQARRRWAAILAVCIVVLAGADWLACAALRRRMRAAYDGWAATVSAQGWAVHSQSMREGGFPFGATLILTGFDLASGHAMLPGGLDWHAERLIVSAGLGHPGRLLVVPQGEQTIRIASARAVVFSADRLVASVPLGRQAVDRLSLEADGLTAGMVRARLPQDVGIEHLRLDLQANRHNAGHVSASASIRATGIALPDNVRWPLGERIKRFACALALTSPALSGGAAAEQARAWRDWGGRLDVNDLRLQWGPADLGAAAQLGLDQDLQPQGKGSATLGGWAQTIDALAAGGTMSAGMGQTVKMVLAMMAPAQPGGDALSLDLTLKDRTLSIGKIPLTQLRTIDWHQE